MIAVQCANCSKQYKLDDKLAGKRVKCKECGTPIAVVAARSSAAGMSTALADNLPAEPDIFGLMESAEAEAAENQLESVALAASHTPPRGPTVPCPACKANVAKGSVICLACGYNFKTGRGGNAAEIPLKEPEAAPAPKRARTNRLRGSELLNSIDGYLGIAIFLLTILGLVVWSIHVVKTASAFSAFLFVPTVITVLMFVGIVAPLMLVAIQGVGYFLKFTPRGDSYTRVLMVLMLPLAMALICGGHVAQNPGLADTISGAWFAAPMLFLFLFRAEALELIATAMAAVVAGFAGWFIAVFAASLVSLATGPLYADTLPQGPWKQIATSVSPPPPAPTTPTPVAVTPATPATPTGPVTTTVKDPTAVVAGSPEPGEPFPSNRSTSDPGTIEMPKVPTPAPGPVTTISPTPVPPVPIPNNDPNSPAPPVPSPRGQVAMGTSPTLPSPTVTPTPNTPSATTPPKPLHSPFLTDMAGDITDLHGASEIINPVTTSSWMISVKSDGGGNTTVTRWSTDPMIKKGELNFQELPKQPNSYALHPNGNYLLVLERFPKWQLQICNFDGKPGKKIAITESLPPGEQDAVPSLIGFIDPLHYALRWDLGGRACIVCYNSPGGDSYRRIVLESAENGVNDCALSPDGHSFAVLSRGFGSNREVQIYDTLGSIAIRRFRPLGMDFACKGIAFSPDSKKIALYTVTKDVTSVVAFNFKGETVNTAILPAQQMVAQPVGLMNVGKVDNSPHGLLWLKGSNLWLVDGAELYDPENGRKIGSMGIPGPVDARLVGINGVALIQHANDDTGRVLIGKIDENALHTAQKH